MATELNWTPGGNMFMARPDVAKGMAEAMKEVAKLDGTPVYQTVTMRAAGTAASWCHSLVDLSIAAQNQA